MKYLLAEGSECDIKSAETGLQKLVDFATIITLALRDNSVFLFCKHTAPMDLSLPLPPASCKHFASRLPPHTWSYAASPVKSRPSYSYCTEKESKLTRSPPKPKSIELTQLITPADDRNRTQSSLFPCFASLFTQIFHLPENISPDDPPTSPTKTILISQKPKCHPASLSSLSFTLDPPNCPQKPIPLKHLPKCLRTQITNQK